jgi:low molecular weight protein-tyrosine phosphatase
MGNICRSPCAEAIFQHLTDEHYAESAAVGGWFVGQAPDERMAAAAARSGYHLCGQARQFDLSDFDRFDLILAITHSILQALQSLARTDEERQKVRLLGDYSRIYKGLDVPDPYYGGEGGFDEVVKMLEEMCNGLLREIKSHTPSPGSREES